MASGMLVRRSGRGCKVLYIGMLLAPVPLEDRTLDDQTRRLWNSAESPVLAHPPAGREAVRNASHDKGRRSTASAQPKVDIDDEEPLVSAWLTQLSFDWSPVLPAAREVRIDKEETLFLEGQPVRSVYVVREGRVRLTSFSLDGRERHLMIVGPTGLVGDCGLLASRRHVVSAVGATDAVLAAVPLARMADAVARDPVLSRQCQQLASHRFRIMLQHLALQASNSALRRVCHHLMGLVDSYGTDHAEGTLISIAFTQQEMGNLCGLSRVSVSNIFTRLEREGVVGRSGRLVLIRDAQRLAALARS